MLDMFLFLMESQSPSDTEILSFVLVPSPLFVLCLSLPLVGLLSYQHIRHLLSSSPTCLSRLFHPPYQLLILPWSHTWHAARPGVPLLPIVSCLSSRYSKIFILNHPPSVIRVIFRKHPPHCLTLHRDSQNMPVTELNL